jgi:serine O-acetyltransferase
VVVVMGSRIGTFRELRTLIREDFDRHGRKRLSPGFHALLVYRFGVWVHDRQSTWLTLVLVRVYRLLAYLVETRIGIEIPYQTIVGRRLWLPHGGRVVLNADARIGDDCVLRHNVTIGSIGGRRSGCPTVGDRVEFGVGAVVVGDIRVGNDVIIGANVVLSEDVPDTFRVRALKPELRPPSTNTLGAERRTHPTTAGHEAANPLAVDLLPPH